MNKKVKKLLSIGVLALSLGAILTACSGKKQGASNNKSSDAKHSIALITDGNGKILFRIAFSGRSYGIF